MMVVGNLPICTVVVARGPIMGYGPVVTRDRVETHGRVETHDRASLRYQRSNDTVDNDKIH